jgi:hypothetical protein
MATAKRKQTTKEEIYHSRAVKAWETKHRKMRKQKRIEAIVNKSAKGHLISITFRKISTKEIRTITGVRHPEQKKAGLIILKEMEKAKNTPTDQVRSCRTDTIISATINHRHYIVK